ncbi:DNA polymerase III subunit delta [Buchnera aphidicola (Eriosoma lanigerum)]|uniref:hypothetical protein n=1 Tax=Buchnera aphidicola TaxID=9 RepID=UPI003463BE70
MNTFYDNLINNLKNQLLSVYILQGKEIILCQESEKIICIYAQKQGYSNKKYFYPINELEWKHIFLIYQMQNIFLKKIILIITIFINDVKNDNYKYIIILLKRINKNIILIIKCYENYFFKKNKIFLHHTYMLGTIVNCVINNKIEFILWFERKINDLKIIMNKKTKKLLYQYYENNLFSLSKILEVISLIYFNSIIKIENIRNIITDEGLFTAYQWAQSVLNGNGIQAIRILNLLHKNNYEPLILIRVLQKILIKIIYQSHNIRTEQKKITKINNNNQILENYNKKKYIHLIYKIIKILTFLEIKIKTNKKCSIWIQLKTLSLILTKYHT